jgi:hypothetical protein
MKKRFLGPLSNDQKAAISILRKQAFEAAQARGAVDDDLSFEAWYRAEMREAVGVESLTDATQALYLAIRGRFFTILGNLEEAFYAFLNGGEENEARRQMAWRLMGEIERLAQGIRAKHEALMRLTPGLADLTPAQAAERAWSYVKTIARDKFGGVRMEALDADQLEELGFTVYNRASAMLGKGMPEARNKAQRKPKAVAPEAPKVASRRSQEWGISPVKERSGGAAGAIRSA